MVAKKEAAGKGDLRRSLVVLRGIRQPEEGATAGERTTVRRCIVLRKTRIMGLQFTEEMGKMALARRGCWGVLGLGCCPSCDDIVVLKPSSKGGCTV